MAELKTLVDELLYNNKEDFFTQKEICERIGEMKIKEDGDNTYSHKSLQSTVSRRLSELIKSGSAIKIGKRYAYKTTQNIHYIVRDEICSKVTFYKNKVFVMSPSVVAVPVNGTTISIAKELFNDYYGDECFYDALYVDEYLLLLLNTEAVDMDIKNIAEDIEEIIKDSKEFEKNQREIRLQLQHARIIKDIVKYTKLSADNNIEEAVKTDDILEMGTINDIDDDYIYEIDDIDKLEDGEDVE